MCLEHAGLVGARAVASGAEDWLDARMLGGARLPQRPVTTRRQAESVCKKGKES